MLKEFILDKCSHQTVAITGFVTIEDKATNKKLNVVNSVYCTTCEELIVIPEMTKSEFEKSFGLLDENGFATREREITIS
jgi:hypothetical protein